MLPQTCLPWKLFLSTSPQSCNEVDGEQRHAAKRTGLTARDSEQIDLRNSFAALVPDLPVPSSLGLPVSDGSADSNYTAQKNKGNT